MENENYLLLEGERGKKGKKISSFATKERLHPDRKPEGRGTILREKLEEPRGTADWESTV